MCGTNALRRASRMGIDHAAPSGGASQASLWGRCLYWELWAWLWSTLALVSHAPVAADRGPRSPGLLFGTNTVHARADFGKASSPIPACQESDPLRAALQRKRDAPLRKASPSLSAWLQLRSSAPSDVNRQAWSFYICRSPRGLGSVQWFVAPQLPPSLSAWSDQPDGNPVPTFQSAAEVRPS